MSSDIGENDDSDVDMSGLIEANAIEHEFEPSASLSGGEEAGLIDDYSENSDHDSASVKMESSSKDGEGLNPLNNQVKSISGEHREKSIGNIMLPIIFSLGELWVTRSELNAIKSDDVFELASDYSGLVSIIAGNCEIGTARIVSINDSLALQIVEIRN